jgi:hypothetical protein
VLALLLLILDAISWGSETLRLARRSIGAVRLLARDSRIGSSPPARRTTAEKTGFTGRSGRTDALSPFAGLVGNATTARAT